jgi:hypothetical protein
MHEIHFDPAESHEAQASRLLRLAGAHGHTVDQVTWDPASGRYRTPEAVADSFHAGLDAEDIVEDVEADDEADSDAGDPQEPTEEAAQAPARRGRRGKASAATAEGNEGESSPSEE